MRSMEMSAKTVEAAVQAACEALGVDRDDINVSYEVLEFPTQLRPIQCIVISPSLTKSRIAFVYVFRSPANICNPL